MDLSLSRDEIAFQSEVREFLESEFPADIKEKQDNGQHLDKEDFIRWQKILHKQGWIAPNWPTEYGGPGWSATQKHLFDHECARVNTPDVIPFGVNMVGPVIYTFGNETQKNRFLPSILASDVWWCQGYSEPGSGSDLASLRCKAEADGDEYYRVTGSKTWTTFAQYADWIFCLVRTSNEGRHQQGISFLLIDMQSPGITVNPIVTMDGGREINEVHFDNVLVPVTNRIGEENKGWTYAKFLLTYERTGIARVARSQVALKRLKAICANAEQGAEPLLNDSDFKRKINELEIDLIALEYTELRTLSAVATGKAPGPESSILKIKGSEIQQRLSELLMEAAGYHAFVYAPQQYEQGYNEQPVGPYFAAATAPHYFNYRKTSIYGGSNEIQKNIIAKAVLGF